MSHDNALLLVLGALAGKHFICDFIYQNGFMLMGKGKPGTAFIKPLAAHCAEHAMATLIIILVYSPQHAWVALVDFAAHFVIDRVKATYKIGNGGVWKPEDKIKNLNRFYAAFGADQMAHSLTYLAVVYLTLNF